MGKLNSNKHNPGLDRNITDETLHTSSVSSSVLRLEITQHRNHLNIVSHESLFGDESTIRHYENVPISPGRVEKYCEEIVITLNRANRGGRLGPGALTRLKELGQVLYDAFFSSNVKQTLHRSRADYLKIYLDDRSVCIPWELLHDGEQFLCHRFNLGRLVKTRQNVFRVERQRAWFQPLEMLVIADPQSDLRCAYEEGLTIRDHMDLHYRFVQVSLRTGNVSPDYVRERIRSHDLVHFAGHAEYNSDFPGKSGWCLTGTVFNTGDIVNLSGNAPMPLLIFSNACQSARNSRWNPQEGFHYEVFGLANAFLLAGVKHYVGTYWEVLDEQSSRFALEFYKCLFSGSTIGEAIRLSRRILIEKYGEESVVWASYVLYGDPCSNYVNQLKSGSSKEIGNCSLRDSVHSSMIRQHSIRFTKDKGSHKKRKMWKIPLGIAAVVAILSAGYWLFSEMSISQYQRNILSLYDEWDFESALHSLGLLEAEKPNLTLAWIFQGHILFLRGKFSAASHAYKAALQSKNIASDEKRQALLGLGRIATVEKNFEQALGYYEKAAKTDLKKSQGYKPQTIIPQDQVTASEALHLMRKAKGFLPTYHAFDTMVHRLQGNVPLREDKEYQEHVDNLIHALSAANPRIYAKRLDTWTSLPLTLWITGFDVEGYSLFEGEEKLFAYGIMDKLLENGRIRPVERENLHYVLSEFKFAKSKLTNHKTMLAMGRMLAARLILTGRVTYTDMQTQVSMRVVETETGEITASCSKAVGNAVSLSSLTESLAQELLTKIIARYPIKGKVIGIDGGRIRLNIGETVGVQVGQQYIVQGTKTMLEILEVAPIHSWSKAKAGPRSLKKGDQVSIVLDS